MALKVFLLCAPADKIICHLTKERKKELNLSFSILNFSFLHKKLAESEKKLFLYFARINHQMLRGLREKKCFHNFYFSQKTIFKKKCAFRLRKDLSIIFSANRKTIFSQKNQTKKLLTGFEDLKKNTKKL